MDVGVRVFKRYSEDDGGVLASALAYYTFFSVFPLLLFTASALGYLTFLSSSFRDRLVQAGLDAFPLLDSLVSVESIAALQQQRGTLAIVGFLLALYSGTGAIVALEHALNRIGRITDEGNALAKRVASLRWLGLLGVAAILSLASGAIAGYTGGLLGADTLGARVLISVLGHAAGFGVGLLIFIGAFRMLAAARPSVREVFPGAAAAAVALEVLKSVGTWYLARGAAGREATFGAFAAAAGLLVASYMLAQITLLAAELNAVLAERRTTRQSSPS